MTLEDEKRLALLAAILRVGGHAPKARVLDTLYDLGLLKLTDHNRAIMPSRREERWRNDLAYVRKHLVDAQYLSDSQHDNWAITDSGRTYAKELAARAALERDGTFVRVAEAAAVVQTEIASVLDDSTAESRETIAIEGAVRKVWTTRYERDPELRVAAIRHHGLACVACRFSFADQYGQLGEGFVEVHHLNPVSALQGSAPVRAETDLVVLCSNCHAMVHRRKGKPLSLAELRAALATK